MNHWVLFDIFQKLSLNLKFYQPHFLQKTFSHIYFHTFGYFLWGIAQIGLIAAPNFVCFVAAYGVYGIGDGLYFGCLAPIACQVAGSPNLANQALGYFYTFISPSYFIGKSIFSWKSQLFHHSSISFKGPAVAAAFFSASGTYTYAYILSATTAFTGCVIQLFYPNGVVLRKIKSVFNYFKF